MPEIRKYKVTLKWPGEGLVFQEVFIEAYDAADALVQAGFDAKKWVRLQGADGRVVHPVASGIEPANPTPPC